MPSRSKNTNGSKARKLALGATMREARLVAIRLMEVGAYFAEQRRALLAAVSGPLSPEHEAFAKLQAAELEAFRVYFVDRLAEDPAAAASDFAQARDQQLPASALRRGKSTAVRDAALGRALVHVEEWLRQRLGQPARFFAMPIGTLGPISKGINRVRSEADLVRLASVDLVRGPLEDSSRPAFRRAAEELVALATGVGEQTVKRSRAALKDHGLGKL
jgi:hypothetical protein